MKVMSVTADAIMSKSGNLRAEGDGHQRRVHRIRYDGNDDEEHAKACVRAVVSVCQL